MCWYIFFVTCDRQLLTHILHGISLWLVWQFLTDKYSQLFCHISVINLFVDNAVSAGHVIATLSSAEVWLRCHLRPLCTDMILLLTRKPLSSLQCKPLSQYQGKINWYQQTQTLRGETNEKSLPLTLSGWFWLTLPGMVVYICVLAHCPWSNTHQWTTTCAKCWHYLICMSAASIY